MEYCKAQREALKRNFKFFLKCFKFTPEKAYEYVHNNWCGTKKEPNIRVRGSGRVSNQLWTKKEKLDMFRSGSIVSFPSAVLETCQSYWGE